MLNILGSTTRYCDGIKRRSFLKAGALSFGAAHFSLSDLLRAEDSQGKSSHKAVINIFLGGGPPHQDMFDLKPEAPSEIRGEFKPIATNVAGIQIGECFPQIAKMMDKFAIVRSIVGAKGGHDAVQCMTGRPDNVFREQGGFPSMGAILSRLVGPVDPSVPTFVGLAKRTQHGPWSDPGKPGFLGSTHSCFSPDGEGMANMRLHGVNRDQMEDRKLLRTSFDSLRREMEVSGAMSGVDAATQRALNVLTSSKLLDALDVSKEPEKVRSRYGDGKPYQFQYDGAPTVNEQLLIARRLVEAGARCVTLSYGRWDSHGKNFDLVRDHGGKLDQCLSALIEDLDMRGMLKDTTVVCWGEFGRTPRINKEAGRDHWPQVSCALLAGGGIKTGQVVGATNRLGEYASARPVTFNDMFATLWKSIGIDPHVTTILDNQSRPTHLSDGQVIQELV
jgi:hypothetical protein